MNPYLEYNLLESSILKYIVLRESCNTKGGRLTWVNSLYKKREKDGEFHKIFKELEEQPEKFFAYFRMTFTTFMYILKEITPRITKYSNFRKCITPKEKLAVTLRYLSTGMSFRPLAFSLRMDHTTIRRLVYETSEAIWTAFQDKHMPFPSAEMLSEIANDFQNKWRFPNCIGCIDGKHIRIKCPSNSGTNFFNYKNFFSIVLQGVADANYRFICVDVGAFGKQSDGGVFTASTLYQHLENGSFNIPPDKNLPNTNVSLPHVLLGDAAYPLKVYLMKPYPQRNISAEEDIFNNKLSQVRRIIECAFGILTSKWRILKTEIEIKPEKVDVIIKSVCLLHNIIINLEGVDNSVLLQMQIATTSSEENNLISNMNFNRRTQDMAYNVRNAFKTYFNAQNNM